MHYMAWEEFWLLSQEVVGGVVLAEQADCAGAVLQWHLFL